MILTELQTIKNRPLGEQEPTSSPLLSESQNNDDEYPACGDGDGSSQMSDVKAIIITANQN